jgi:ABC-type nitrate/sulfonate/bicarbonate transport system substrate-binding protein
VNILQLGGMPELAAALSKRLIVAAPLSAPTHIRARAAGAQPLLDMAKAGVYFPHTAVITKRSFLRANRETALNFFRGYSEGLQRFVQDRSSAKKSYRSTPVTTLMRLLKRRTSTPSIMWSGRRIRTATVSSRLSG